MTINYGDGSPVLQWSQENPFNILRHGYLRSGTYDMSLTVENIYDGTLNKVEKKLLAQTSVQHYDHWSQVDIICPTAVEPGTFFTCQLYVLDEQLVKAELVDAISETVEDTTDWIRVPSKYSLILILGKLQTTLILLFNC